MAEPVKPTIEWYSGPTGVGKTMNALRSNPGACVMNCKKGMWFDKYDGSDTVIFDEFRHDSIDWQDLLSMTTYNHGLELPVKGSFIFFQPKKIIFTSPEKAATEFSYRNRETGEKTLRDDGKQFIRRLDKEMYFEPTVKAWIDITDSKEKYLTYQECKEIWERDVIR